MPRGNEIRVVEHIAHPREPGPDQWHQYQRRHIDHQGCEARGLSTAESAIQRCSPDPTIAGLLMLIGLYSLIFGISSQEWEREVFGLIALAMGAYLVLFRTSAPYFSFSKLGLSGGAAQHTLVSWRAGFGVLRGRAYCLCRPVFRNGVLGATSGQWPWPRSCPRSYWDCSWPLPFTRWLKPVFCGDRCSEGEEAGHRPVDPKGYVLFRRILAGRGGRRWRRGEGDYSGRGAS